MAYVRLSDLAGLVPSEFLTQALDDTNAGTINDDLFNQIAADVSAVIDGYLGTRFSVPFIPDPVSGLYPPFVFNAAKKLLAEQLYKRRGVADDKNPWAAECGQLRTMMKAMAIPVRMSTVGVMICASHADSHWARKFSRAFSS